MIPVPPSFIAGVRRSLAHPPSDIDPWFGRYYDDLGSELGLVTYLRAKQQLLGLVGGWRSVQGKRVLDAGSGFGMVSNLMAAWGARHVLALELFPPMAETHRRVLAAHFPELVERISIVEGDVKRVPVRPGSVDLLLSIEAISHYHDVDAFLDECARVVRPGGHLLISDGNNGANPGLRRFTVDLWERYELGPAGRFGDREVGDSMLDRRHQIIAATFPGLPSERVRALAEGTSGMVRDEIVRAVQEHLAGGPAPAKRYRRGELPRDPLHGYVLEALFDPPELAARLARRGFEAHAVPHYGGARNDLLLAADRVLRQLPGFRFARAFRVVARRR